VKQLLVASAIPVGCLFICQIFPSIIVDQWKSRICKHSRVGTRLSEYLQSFDSSKHVGPAVHTRIIFIYILPATTQGLECRIHLCPPSSTLILHLSSRLKNRKGTRCSATAKHTHSEHSTFLPYSPDSETAKLTFSKS
jgi:hypothetical protein